MIITKNDITFKVEGHHSWFFETYVKETWEPHTWKILKEYVSKETIFFDIGAWIGIITLPVSYVAKMCYSFEPDPLAFKTCQNNILLNSRENVKLYNMAITNYTGNMSLGNLYESGDSRTKRNTKKNEFVVSCTSLSEFCQKENIERVDFIKIDVEGSEELILKDFTFFEKYNPIVYLSLHPDWIDDKNEFTSNINRLKSLYTKVKEYEPTYKNFNEMLFIN